MVRKNWFQVREMLEFKPLKSIEPFKGLKCFGNIRNCQCNGCFLYDNHFEGLLCDEMGLGKTIQIITFLLGIKRAAVTLRSFSGGMSDFGDKPLGEASR